MMTGQRSFRTLLIAAVFLLAANILITLFSRPPSSQAQDLGRQRIMYKVVKTQYDEQSIQTVVDLFSRDGWELVTHYNEILIFKK